MPKLQSFGALLAGDTVVSGSTMLKRGSEVAVEGLRNLVRPHYVFRPTQLFRRARFQFEASRDARRTRLPWGAMISYCPTEVIGLALARRGVFDSPLCEVLLRLTDPGESAIDAGANVGVMTSLLGHAVGSNGTVFAFEPHPVVFARLVENVAQWGESNSMGRVVPQRLALSDRDGRAFLATVGFAANQGSASLGAEPSTGTREGHGVVKRRLDTLFGAEETFGVMKIDVEGHELEALRGAESITRSGSVRDILFEEHRVPPTPVTELLGEQGYAIFQFDERLIGLTVRPIVDVGLRRPRDDRSFLATRDPERALARLRVPGWAIYRVGPAGRRWGRRDVRDKRSRLAAV